MVTKYLYKPLVINTFFAIALVLVVGIGFITMQNVRKWKENTQLVMESHEVWLLTEQMFSAVKDAEDAFQRYAATKDQNDLVPYHQARQRISSCTRRFNSLHLDNSDKHLILGQIKSLVWKRMDNFSQNIARINAGQAMPQQPDTLNMGQRMMDSLRTAVYNMEDTEKDTLRRRSQELLTSSNQTTYTQLVGLAIALAFLIGTFTALKIQMRERIEAAKTIEQYNATLEQKVQERTRELNITNEELKNYNEELNAILEQQAVTQRMLEEKQAELEQAYATIKVDNERKTQEIEEARELQLCMLPQKPPAIEYVDMATYMKTATEVGGDYYDYKINERNNSLTVALGDATGHGLKAGIVVSTVKSYFSSVANQYAPWDIMKHISQGIRNLQLKAMYMGLTIVRLNSRQMTIASAGMPPLYLYRKLTDTVEEIELRGMFLGSPLHTDVNVFNTDIDPGDVLIGMTDGFFELRNENKDMMSRESIGKYYKEVVHLSAAEIIERFVHLAEEWAGGVINHDDITFVVVKIK